MFDDETGAEPKIVAASIVDPFILLIRDDASIFVAQCDEDNELEEVERADDALVANKWLTGCLYKDTSGIFYAKDAVIMALLNTEGTLFVSIPTSHSVILLTMPDLRTPRPRHPNLHSIWRNHPSASHRPRLCCKALHNR